MQTAEVLRGMLMYVVLPLWLAAGLAWHVLFRNVRLTNVIEGSGLMSAIGT